MKKIIANISAFILIVVGLIALAGCKSSKTFYSEWHGAGAVIEKENVFKSVDVDEAAAMLNDSSKNTFALFFGASTDSSAVASMTALQYTADVKNYEGKVYFLTTTDSLKSTSKMKDINDKLGKVGVEEFKDIVCVLYENGSVKFNTNKENDYEDQLKQFKIGSKVNIIAVMEYVIELYPVIE